VRSNERSDGVAPCRDDAVHREALKESPTRGLDRERQEALKESPADLRDYDNDLNSRIDRGEAEESNAIAN
jgi:hypothetical protein